MNTCSLVWNNVNKSSSDQMICCHCSCVQFRRSRHHCNLFMTFCAEAKGFGISTLPWIYATLVEQFSWIWDFKGAYTSQTLSVSIKSKHNTLLLKWVIFCDWSCKCMIDSLQNSKFATNCHKRKLSLPIFFKCAIVLHNYAIISLKTRKICD